MPLTFRSVACLALIYFSAAFQLRGQDAYRQKLEQQAVWADSLLRRGDFYDAVTEYQRLAFFDTGKVFFAHAYTGMAAAFTQGGRYAEAQHALGRLLTLKQTDSSYFALNIEMMKLALLDRKYPAAYTIIENLEADDRYASRSGALHYWRGWCALLQDDWQMAEKEFARCDSAAYLKNFCGDVHNQKYPVSFVKTISLFLPGSGMIYTGHYFQGLVSLGWNALFGYLTVNAFVAERVLDGFLVGDLLLLRFYTGGYERAGQLAESENRAIANKALHFLVTEYQGAKP